MQSLRSFVVRALPILALLFVSSAAFAWNCSDPLASRVDVGTAKPSGSSGNGDGQYFLGTGAEGTKGHYYVCEVPKPPTKGGGGSCKGHSCNSSSGSSSSSTSNSGATATGGNATATGGSVSGSGNSTVGPITSTSGVKNSGNSSNTNTNTANGGAGGAGGSAQQSQTQSSTSSANNTGGNSSNSYSSETNVEASKIPVATAYAPTTIPTVTCFKGFGAGVQTMAIGGSFGGGKIDENCAILETARSFDAAGERLAACKVKISNKYAKAAGVTLEDCMKVPPTPIVDIPAPPTVSPVQIYLPANTPAAVIPTPVVETPAVPVAVVDPEHLVGICTFNSAVSCTPKEGPSAGVGIVTVNSICRQMLVEARRQLRINPNAVLLIRGNRNASEDKLTAVSRANNVKKSLEADGVPASRLKTEVGTGTSRTVEIVLVPQA